MNAVDAAIGAGLDFVLAAQHADGLFVDWALPPGPALAWPTAYIGLVLAELPADQRRARRAALAAARWLQAHPAPGGGWGYNEGVAADADSTAFALRLLARVGAPVEPVAVQRLLSFQRADGGFSTYGREEGLGAWGLSHVDVSAGCGRALAAVGASAAALRRCVDFVAARRAGDGRWPAFWWRTPWYATHAALDLLGAQPPSHEAAGSPALACPVPDAADFAALHPFERALALECATLSRVDRARRQAMRARLLADQQPDGSWPSAPVLRLARRDRAEPGAGADGGPLFGDPRRLFTTITVVRALAADRAAPDA